MEQYILRVDKSFDILHESILSLHPKKILLVCEPFVNSLPIGQDIFSFADDHGITVGVFNSFESNPRIESVVNGIEFLRTGNYDLIIGLGGGSAIDVAKCIKYFANADISLPLTDQEPVQNDLTLWAIPTTAGTGSESTPFAVVYENGQKRSIDSPWLFPTTVVLDPTVLYGLPDYQKKSTMADAFCHAIESIWNVHATDYSRLYAREAISLILNNWSGYLCADPGSCKNMMEAARLAGKAIAITRTTAGHAMCYKLTSLYGIAHGHAASVCVHALWPWMLENINRAKNPIALNKAFSFLSSCMGCSTSFDSFMFFHDILTQIGLLYVPSGQIKDLDLLSESVNLQRLKNNPISLQLEEIRELYRTVLSCGV